MAKKKKGQTIAVICDAMRCDKISDISADEGFVLVYSYLSRSFSFFLCKGREGRVKLRDARLTFHSQSESKECHPPTTHPSTPTIDYATASDDDASLLAHNHAIALTDQDATVLDPAAGAPQVVAAGQVAAHVRPAHLGRAAFALWVFASEE